MAKYNKRKNYYLDAMVNQLVISKIKWQGRRTESVLQGILVCSAKHKPSRGSGSMPPSKFSQNKYSMTPFSTYMYLNAHTF